MCQDCGSGGGRSVEPKSMLNRICYHWHIHAYGSVSEIHVMHVSGMIQGCVRDVSGTSYGIEYVIIGIYMQCGSVSDMHVMTQTGCESTQRDCKI